ncbi:MAG: hypothetical protein GY708_01425 [Actinomycetia bacterium]|nr:hypothetical protein [Actinomycetes bacterium]
MTLQLTDVQRSLGLFAEGLAGHVVRVEALADDRLGWPWRLGLPDPSVVELAAISPLPEPEAAQRKLYRVQVLHQLALVEFGTFGPDPTAPEPTTLERHPVIIESARPDLALGLVVLLEHLRVASATRRRYPGARDDLDRALEIARSARKVDERYNPSHAGFVEALHLRSIGGTRAELADHCPLVDDPSIDWLCDLTDDLERVGATLEDSARVAVAIVERLAPPSPVRTGDTPPEHIEEPGEDDGQDLEQPGIEGFSTTPPLDADVEADRTGGDLDGSTQAGPIPLAQEVEQMDALGNPQPRARTKSDLRGIVADTRTFMYDEWNYLNRAYERSWCRVVERHLEGDHHDFIGDVRRRYAELGSRIRRQFAMLRPDDRMRVYRRDDGDELDFDAVIEAIVDRRSGVMIDDRLNIRRDRTAREVATAFLVDLSASTSSPAEEPEPVPAAVWDDDDDPWEQLLTRGRIERNEPPVRRVIDVAKDSVALMCDALGQLGDQHAVYGFSGEGRHDVEFHISKELDDRTSPATWASLAAMEPISYTRMGPAIRHAAKKLAACEARTKLLIVISDGYPQDSDYGPDRRDRSYGVHDTARAIGEATASGVDTFCVTIDPAGHDYLRLMFPDNRYLVIDEVESLPAELAKLYLNLAGGRAANRGGDAIENHVARHPEG